MEEKTKMKPRGGNSPVIGSNGIHTKPGDNSKYTGVLLQIMQWGKVERSDVNALEERFWQYVDYCNKSDVRITNQAAYLALGLSKDNVYDMEHGRSFGSAHSEFIKKVKAFCAAYREMLGADGKINPVTLVWWQKNYDGLVDKQEIEVKASGQLQPTLSPEEIAKQIPKDIPVDVDYSEE
jgi:hypothetical protein